MSPRRITGENSWGHHSWGLEEGTSREKGPRFPSSISERPSRPLGPQRNYAIVTGGAFASAQSASRSARRRGSSAPLKVHQKRQRKMSHLFSCEGGERLCQRERERTLVISLALTGGLRVRQDKGKGNQTKRSDAGNEGTPRIDGPILITISLSASA